jgi:bZIP transcription factor.
MKAVRSDKKKRGGWVINNKDLLAKITPKERQALAADAKKQKRRFRGIVPPPLGTSPAALSKEQVKGLRWALRRLRNVDSAKTSRANRKKELDELRDENSLLWDENDELTDENASLLVQLDRLRSMLGGGGGGAVMMIAAFVGIGLGGLGDSAGDAGVNISLGPAADPADGFQARTLLAADADHAECVVPAVGDPPAAPDGFFAGSPML